ncbi:ABC transporter permease subunit [Rubinisphaera margarita]|uniref:ABC transporter permease subunit n=1 Tax=Rubinisphaera margarita TaxID=2909586 RepID=UPI001EE7F88E|nr:ABC transporter permease subunit [Rubinisphaera margarita]MCG6157501.1 ABC transporter permease [Rubinisphaera margarita]
MIEAIAKLSLLAQDVPELDPTMPTNPLAGYGWTALVALIGLIVLFGLNRFTKFGVIARATSKESVRQPMFFSLLLVAIVVMLLNTWIPFFSMGDDTKMFLDCGLATVLICSLLLAIWTSSISIADEIEGKTAMTLLSKPITRRQFIVGKYLGLLQGVVIFMIPVVITFALLTYYKVGYDMKEAGKQVPEYFRWVDSTLFGSEIQYAWFQPERIAPIIQVLPGILLIFFEVAVMAAISVVISTRLPMVVNLSVMFAIFVIGHLTPVLVQSSETRQELEFVSFVARLFATVLPNLDAFNMSASIATGTLVPPDYLGFAALYGLAYCAGAILLAFILFEDRDLA